MARLNHRASGSWRDWDESLGWHFSKLVATYFDIGTARTCLNKNSPFKQTRLTCQFLGNSSLEPPSFSMAFNPICLWFLEPSLKFCPSDIPPWPPDVHCKCLLPVLHLEALYWPDGKMMIIGPRMKPWNKLIQAWHVNTYQTLCFHMVWHHNWTPLSRLEASEPTNYTWLFNSNLLTLWTRPTIANVEEHWRLVAEACTCANSWFLENFGLMVTSIASY